MDDHGPRPHRRGRGYAVTRIIPGTPAEPADIVGCATWWLLSSRADLAPPPGR